MDNTTYYQRNGEIMLNRVKDYYENDKERLREQARNNIETYLKKIKIKKENMEKNRYIICLMKRSKNWKNIKNEDVEKQKSLRIMNNNLIVYLLFSSILLSPSI